MSRRSIQTVAIATALALLNVHPVYAADPYMDGNAQSVRLDSGAVIGADYLRGLTCPPLGPSI